jgi:hypothetical protein
MGKEEVLAANILVLAKFQNQHPYAMWNLFTKVKK